MDNIVAVELLEEDSRSPLYRCKGVIIREANWDAALADMSDGEDYSSLEEALDSYQWFCEVKSDEQGRYIEIEGNLREESGCEDEILGALCSYLEDGAEIQFFEGANFGVFRDRRWQKVVFAIACD